jgi:asparagine synthase (glutamine-hydrolysing)
MCGITGFSGAGDASILTRMNNTLTHRGPDDAGTHLFPHPRTERITGLAQRRLSIIDLSPAGHQPLSNEDGTVWIAFNGEIYNHRALRAELTRTHTFRGASDTEVIVHLYEELGEAVFAKLEGMFAIALYDTKKDRLFLARDRMGKKPLFYSVQQGTLFFGSELKALMAHPAFVRTVDPVSLNKYFLYEYVPTPHTILTDTYKLEPGTYLTWDGKGYTKTPFWKPTFLPKSTSFDASLSALDTALTQAVETRLVADVPVGIFLSGGLDSSAVAYYATKVHSGKVKTFAIGFDEPSFDESGFARTVAEHLGTEHYEHRLAADECRALIPEIGTMLDEPMADSSIVPTYLLSKFTRAHVTVALGGDGGDELFCGYDTFLAHRLAAVYERLPAYLRRQIERVGGMLPTSHSNMSLDFKIKKFTAGFDGSPAYRNQRWLGAFGKDERGQLFTQEIWSQVSGRNEFDDIDRYLTESDSRERYDTLGYLYQRMYMMDQVLVKVDRASMMHALEVRAPFLDTRVVDIANHLPVEYKLRGTTRKYILKKLMEGKLPHEIIYRKKKGFGMPIGYWMQHELRPLVTDLLSTSSLARIGFFNPTYVERLVTEHLAGSHDHRKQLWTLLVFVMWWNRWMDTTVSH